MWVSCKWVCCQIEIIEKPVHCFLQRIMQPNTGVKLTIFEDKYKGNIPETLKNLKELLSRHNRHDVYYPIWNGVIHHL